MIKVDNLNSFESDLLIAIFSFDEYKLSRERLKADVNRNSSVVYLPNTKQCRIIDKHTGTKKLAAFSIQYPLSLLEPTEDTISMLERYIDFPRRNTIYHDINKVISQHCDFKNRSRHYHLIPKGIISVLKKYKRILQTSGNDIKFGKCQHRFGKMWTFQDDNQKIDIDKKKTMEYVAFCSNFNIVIFIETADPTADLIIMGDSHWVMNYYFNLK